MGTNSAQYYEAHKVAMNEYSNNYRREHKPKFAAYGRRHYARHYKANEVRKKFKAERQVFVKCFVDDITVNMAALAVALWGGEK